MTEKEPVKLLILEASQNRAEELIDMVKSLQSTGVLTAISGAENPVVLSTLWAGRREFYTGILYFAATRQYGLRLRQRRPLDWLSYSNTHPFV